MARFATFVDGSNLQGSLQHLGVRVDDYEKLYNHIFQKAVKAWHGTWICTTPPPAQHVRVYWYVVSTMDKWALDDARSVDHLRERFNRSKDVKRLWLAAAGEKLKLKTHDQDRIEREAFALWFDDFKAWYRRGESILDGMLRFYHGVESGSEFIEFQRTGHWKVFPLKKSKTEKGLDTSFAVDMVGLVDSYDVALLISGDADAIPALKHVKRAGKHVCSVEFIKGYPPEKRGKSFSSKLNLVSDFVVQVYEMELVQQGIAKPYSTDTTEVDDE